MNLLLRCLDKEDKVNLGNNCRYNIFFMEI